MADGNAFIKVNDELLALIYLYNSLSNTYIIIICSTTQTYTTDTF
jgi:hypothetical protein